MNELLLLSGLAGLLAGMLISRKASEEVVTGRTYFLWARDGSFMLASALFLYAFGIVTLVVVLLSLSIFIRVASPRVKHLIIACVLPLMLFFTLSNPGLSSPLSAIYALVGVLYAGIVSADQQSLSRKALRSQHAVTQVVFIVSPLLLLVIALVTT